jgi:hypothetical protein
MKTTSSFIKQIWGIYYTNSQEVLQIDTEEYITRNQQVRQLQIGRGQRHLTSTGGNATW